MTDLALRDLADVLEHLRGDAARLEREGVERADVERLAGAGLLAVHGPPELGGLPQPVQREVAEQLAGASPDAWFVWFQHGPVVRMLVRSDRADLAERHLPDLCAGRALGAVAYSHLRTPHPSILATRTGTGWTLTGRQPWCTGWPLADQVLVGALDPVEDRVLFALVPAGDRPALHSTGELALAAMGGTRTHALALDDLQVPEDSVVAVWEREAFTAYDLALNANVQPSTYGVALAALDLLAERHLVAAQRLRAPLLANREEAYHLLDEVPADEQLERRLELRGEALALAVRCCTALLAAHGGQGMDLAEPAQRLLRAAAFQVVHSSAAHVRAATLDALTAGPA